MRALFFSLPCLLAWTARSLQYTPCTIQTSQATLQGHSSHTKSEVCEWLGLPYASPPVGQLRFAPPVQTAIQGRFEADKYGADCPQNQAAYFAYPNATAQYAKIYSNFVNQANHTQSEDCLTLNIWSQPSETSKPVMMFIHGGRYSAGTSNTPYYDGQFLASSQDVVVVTFNFRLNIFGFPGAPEAVQNLGFLDQYAAVSWVHENIAAFGGDPSRITIVGQSSGGVAVSNWAYAFKEKPIVAGLMSHSGNVFSFPSNDLDLAARNWYNVSGTLGCGTSGNTLDCMRSPNISFASILAATRRVPPAPNNSPTRSQPSFQMTVDNKTAFSVADYTTRLASGNIARIPYFQIDNAHESGFYRISALAQGRSPSEEEWAAFEQSTFTCPLALEAEGKSKLDIPTYRAIYMADWSNLRLYNPPSSGAYHGVELNSVIGNSQGVSGIMPEAAQVELTEVMQSAWAAFAYDPVKGVHGLGWPRYNTATASLVQIGVNTTSKVDLVSSRDLNAVCSGPRS